MPVRGVLAEADVGDHDERGQFALEGLDGALHDAVDLVALGLADQRAHVGLGIGRVAVPDQAEVVLDQLDDLVVVFARHQQPRRQRTALAGMEYENRFVVDYCIYDKATGSLLTKATTVQVAVKEGNSSMEMESPPILINSGSGSKI